MYSNKMQIYENIFTQHRETNSLFIQKRIILSTLVQPKNSNFTKSKLYNS
jgi:hypothetical protein